ncbi:MAG: YihY/virulence factor BrkB family protein [Rickettsia endosymbiont of Culicoides impunctatus]|uniref:YihY/virulence factor BrkB family protein n=1 Tax=unclassified Candidatus Tisiphia TaxID=2996318 RepID=UPI001E7AA835|nr:YihY/virulence factor BrkB family protein [Rickettsia endosymbiont of Platyusa sonomae]UCM85642.1 MAG: YihY/virulence factor BrkB family protein [Rickettsia endosymbiont of Culicoides impunctatus]
MKRIIKCLYQAILKTIEHDGVEHSGYMSFMILMAFFPFLVFLLALTSFIGASELGQNFITIFLESMPELATDSIKTRINELSKTPPQSLMTVAIVGSIWTASSFVECLRTILNRVYEIKSPPPYIRRRLLSIVQFLVISIFVTFAMFILIIVPIILTKLPMILQIMEEHMLALTILRYVIIFCSLFITSSSLYYIVPNITLNFTEVVPGALLTVILWVISGYLLSTWIRSYNQLSIIYGSLGGIIGTLIFFYIINMIFIYGAEFNYLLKKHLPVIK